MSSDTGHTDTGHIEQGEQTSEKISHETFASKINSVSDCLETMTKTYDKINTIGSEIIRIEDLLTVFQGTTPNEGCIIIAMTNKFEENKQHSVQRYLDLDV